MSCSSLRIDFVEPRRAREQRARPVADVALDLFERELGEAVHREGMIGRRRDVAPRVDQRAVEVEDDGADHPPDCRWMARPTKNGPICSMNSAVWRVGAHGLHDVRERVQLLADETDHEIVVVRVEAVAGETDVMREDRPRRSAGRSRRARA